MFHTNFAVVVLIFIFLSLTTQAQPIDWHSNAEDVKAALEQERLTKLKLTCESKLSENVSKADCLALIDDSHQRCINQYQMLSQSRSEILREFKRDMIISLPVESTVEQVVAVSPELTREQAQAVLAVVQEQRKITLCTNAMLNQAYHEKIVNNSLACDTHIETYQRKHSAHWSQFGDFEIFFNVIENHWLHPKTAENYGKKSLNGMAFINFASKSTSSFDLFDANSLWLSGYLIDPRGEYEPLLFSDYNEEGESFSISSSFPFRETEKTCVSLRVMTVNSHESQLIDFYQMLKNRPSVR